MWLNRYTYLLKLPDHVESLILEPSADQKTMAAGGGNEFQKCRAEAKIDREWRLRQLTSAGWFWLSAAV